MGNNEYDNAQTDKEALVEFVIQPQVHQIVAEHGFWPVVRAIERIAKSQGIVISITRRDKS